MVLDPSPPPLASCQENRWKGRGISLLYSRCRAATYNLAHICESWHTYDWVMLGGRAGAYSLLFVFMWQLTRVYYDTYDVTHMLSHVWMSMLFVFITYIVCIHHEPCFYSCDSWHICIMTHTMSHTCCHTYEWVMAHTAHWGDQTWNTWNSRSTQFSGRSFDWRGLRLLTWQPVWNLGTPEKTCWICMGTWWKLVGYFCSRNYLKSDLFRTWYEWVMSGEHVDEQGRQFVVFLLQSWPLYVATHMWIMAHIWICHAEWTRRWAEASVCCIAIEGLTCVWWQI